MSATNAADRDQDAPVFPLAPRQKALLMMAVMAGTMMQVLDTTIANVALPHMQAALGATHDSITWVLTSYIIASAVVIPITGWLADRVGARRLFISSTVMFIIASMLCGISTNLAQMVAFRLIQGVAGAFMLPLAQTAMLDLSPRSKHGQAMAIYGMGVMVGPVLGPVLGGWLTDNFSWRWVYYINLPIGLACLAGLWLLLPEKPLTRRPFDVMGFWYLAFGLGALQLMLDRGAHVGWFDATEIWVEMGISIAFFWMFVVHMFTGKRPLFHPEMLADRNLLTGMLFLFVVGMIMLAGMALLPPLLQNIYGYPALDTGTLLATRGVGVMAGMALTGRLAEKIDPRFFVVMGFVMVAASLWVMTGWSLDIDEHAIIYSGLLQGLGMGIVFVPLNVMTFATLKLEFRTDASAMVNLSRSIGSSVGVSIVYALLARNIQTSHSDLAGHITQFSLPVDPNMALSMGPLDNAVMGMIDAEINRQAAMIAYLNDFYFMMWISIAAIPLALLLRRPKRPPPREAGHLAMD